MGPGFRNSHARQKLELSRAPRVIRRGVIDRGKSVRAMTILPGVANSAELQDVPEPPKDDGAILVETIALGVCGTDHEIVAGHYGEAPDGHEIGRGLVAYDAEDAEKIRGKSSSDVLLVLGIEGRAEMVHRDDLVLGQG